VSETRDFSIFTHTAPDGTAHMEIAVEGVRCGGCIGRIESTVKGLTGVADARLNFTNRRLTVVWSDKHFDPSAAIDTLAGMGYRAYPFRPRNVEEEETRQSSFLLRCLAVAGFAAMNIMLLSVSVWSGNVTDITPETRDLFHWLSALIALPAAAYAGQPFFRSAWQALKARHTNMDVPISIGILLALGLSLAETASHAEHAYFDSAVMLIFFLLCGRYLDHAMRRRTRMVAGNLAALKAETACKILDDGELAQVPAAALQAGDRILVRPGERIAADGVVAGGRANLDQSLITGETAPHSVAPGAQVYAGSINLDGTLTLRVTGAAENSLIDEIDRLLDKAVRARSRYVRLADRAARLYAPVVHTAAALTFAGWMLAGVGFHTSILIAISVLIITCPCALALAIPAVQVVAAGKLFRSGVFLNSGDAIERLAEADTIVFDKTGTLTLPEPRVINIGAVAPELVEAAAHLAAASRHPLAAALARHRNGTPPEAEITEEPGRGIRATMNGREMRLGSAEFCGIAGDPALAQAEAAGASTICFRSGRKHAVFIVHQSLRPGAAATVWALRSLGFDIRILSGDRPAAVAQVARDIGVDEWRAGMTPADKVAALEEMKARGRRVLMVGDGLNDAPSLAAAHVSMSPITAADLSQAQADAVFLGERLDPVRDTLAAARKARRLMHQNLGLAVVYNMIAVPLAIAGHVTPLIAAAAMSGSSLIVITNALRARNAGKATTEPEPAATVTTRAAWTS
jgi:Cu2+-exporting ATPase